MFVRVGGIGRDLESGVNWLIFNVFRKLFLNFRKCDSYWVGG